MFQVYLPCCGLLLVILVEYLRTILLNLIQIAAGVGSDYGLTVNILIDYIRASLLA